MRAAYINQTGTIDEIKIGNLEIPTPKNNEALIKVHAVSVNNVDTYVRSGSYQTDLPFPFTLGRDAVGEIVDLGSDNPNYKIGDLVWTNSMGHHGRQGVTSQFISVPFDRLYRVPNGVNELQLVASVHSSATAAIVLDSIFKVEVGKTILIEGAAGNVGRKLVQLAHQKRLNIITTSAPTSFGLVKTLGSDFQIEYNDNLLKAINLLKAPTPDYIIDTSGRADFQANLSVLNPYGTVILITAPTNNQFSFKVSDFYMNNLNIKGFVISDASVEQLKNAAKVLNKNFEQGQLLDDSLDIQDFSKIKEIHQKISNHTAGGKKFILTF